MTARMALRKLSIPGCDMVTSVVSAGTAVTMGPCPLVVLGLRTWVAGRYGDKTEWVGCVKLPRPLRLPLKRGMLELLVRVGAAGGSQSSGSETSVSDSAGCAFQDASPLLGMANVRIRVMVTGPSGSLSVSGSLDSSDSSDLSVSDTTADGCSSARWRMNSSHSTEPSPGPPLVACVSFHWSNS